MKPFHYHEDPMYAAAAAILAGQTIAEESTQQLDESSDTLEEGVKTISEDVFKKLLTKAALMFTSAKDVADGWYEGASAEMKKMKSALTRDNVEKFVAASAALSRVHDDASSMKSGKDAMAFLSDAAKIESLIMKYTEEILKKGVIRKENKSYDLEEGVEDIADIVDGLKKGDKTNFGVVTDIGSNSISFKAKDLPVTKILFNQRKMGSKDFVLDKLVKLKEDAEMGDLSLEEGFGLGTATITAPGNKLHGKQVTIFHKFDDGRLNVQYANSSKKGDVTNLTLQKDQYKLD